MIQHLLFAGALRGALVLGATLLAMPLLKRAASATRRLVLALGLLTSLAVPALSTVLPAWHVEAPAIVAPLRGKVVSEPLVPGDAVSPATAPAAAGASSQAVSVWRMDPLGAIAWVWAVGALLLVGRLAASHARARALVRRAAPASGWQRACARVEHTTGRRVAVRETAEVEVPAVCGVLSPVVLVPPAAAAWDEECRHHVLLHETAHVLRHDCLVQILAELAVALHWMDPLAWLCARRLRVERELAADDVVIAHGARPSSYAEDLLAVAGALPAPAGAIGMGEPARLVARVNAVLATSRNRAPLGAARTAAVVAGVSFAAVAVACTAPAESVGRSPASAPAAQPTSAATAGAGSSLDPTLQTIADDELDRTLREWSAPAGVVVILDPSTGRVLADAGRDHGARADVARLHAGLPGSTLKVVTLAAALDDGVVSPADSIDCGNGEYRYPDGKRLEDSRQNGTLPLPQVLAVSSNVGFAKLADRIGGDRLERALRALHFGAPPGAIPSPIIDHTMSAGLAAIGESIMATPLQIAAAYAAIANGGSYIEPTFSVNADAPRREPVMKPETARQVIAMLDEVVNGENGTGKLARVAGVRAAGKTGTAEWDLPGRGAAVYASFVGIVPEESPRFVILVGIEQPKDNGEGAGGWNVAAPSFARIAARALPTSSR